MRLRTSGKHALNEISNVTEDNAITFGTIRLPRSQWFDLYALKHRIYHLHSIALAGIEDGTIEPCQQGEREAILLRTGRGNKLQ